MDPFGICDSERLGLRISFSGLGLRICGVGFGI